MSLLRLAAVVVVCVMAVSACASSPSAGVPEVFDAKNALHYTSPALKVKPGAENGIKLVVTPYVDGRAERDSHHLGVITARVFGISGTQLTIDHTVTDITTDNFKRRFLAAGFTVADAAADYRPAFELSGEVKRLVVNSKNRDEVDIAIETSLKDMTTGKVIWSALVTEKGDRFAGVAGNSKDDLVDYLNRSLGVVANKTVDAVNALLMASYPQLFNLTPGTKTIAGVTVYSAPLTPAPVAPVVVPAAAVVAEVPAAVTGTLMLNGKPARAKVRLDGVYFGLIPLRTELPVGIHEVEVQAPGYKSYSEKISIRKGDVTEMDVSLKH